MRRMVIVEINLFEGNGEDNTSAEAEVKDSIMKGLDDQNSNLF